MTVIVPVIRRVKAPVSDVWIRKAVAATLRGVKEKSASEVGVVFVSDREMMKLNTMHRRKKKTTDVLSFGNDATWPEAGENARMLGDIVISVAQARRQAGRAKKTLESEIALLIIHGVLHLLGYDHVTVRQEKAMFSLQTRILKTLGYA